MSHDLDLVVVQRDAVLLDALAERTWRKDTCGDLDPIAGLLAALAADVDDDLPDATVAAAASAVPLQRRHEDRQATILPLHLALPPDGRRHIARAVAALVVTAALLSVSGVAAAVSGDPLTPYKRVIDVVRGGYDQVVPKGLVAPRPVIAPPSSKVVAPKATAAVERARGEVASRASRAAVSRQFWDRHVGDRAGWDRTGRHRYGGSRESRDGHGWGSRHQSGSDGSGSRSGHDSSGQRQTGFGDGGGSGRGGRDSGERGGQSGDPRR